MVSLTHRKWWSLCQLPLNWGTCYSQWNAVAVAFSHGSKKATVLIQMKLLLLEIVIRLCDEPHFFPLENDRLLHSNTFSYRETTPCSETELFNDLVVHLCQSRLWSDNLNNLVWSFSPAPAPNAMDYQDFLHRSGRTDQAEHYEHFPKIVLASHLLPKQSCNCYPVILQSALPFSVVWAIDTGFYPPCVLMIHGHSPWPFSILITSKIKCSPSA